MRKWPVIRHLRYVYYTWCFVRWWNAVGSKLGAVPNERDIQHLDDIWHGRA